MYCMRLLNDRPNRIQRGNDQEHMASGFAGSCLDSWQLGVQEVGKEVEGEAEEVGGRETISRMAAPPMASEAL